jgi:tetratricopeptide (TPR) repeat protein
MIDRLLSVRIKKGSLVVIGILLLIGCGNSGENADDYLQRAKKLFEKGEYEKARLELKNSKQMDDNQAETYYYLALLDEKNKNFKSLKENLSKVVELDPHFLDARLKLGKVLILFGEPENALAQAEAVLTIASENQDALVIKASSLMKLNKKQEALTIVDRVLERNDKNIDAISLKASYYLDNGELVKALSSINKALEIDESNIALHSLKIKIHIKAQDVKSIIEEYKELINLFPKSLEFKIKLASIYSLEGKLNEAEELLYKTEAENPDKLGPKIVLLNFLKAKNNSKVITQYEQFLDRYKDQPRVLLNLTRWMIEAKYLDEAINGLNRVVELEEETDIALDAKNQLAEIAIEKSDYDKAEEIINEILTINPNFVVANFTKARLLMLEKHHDEAISLLNSVVWNKPNSMGYALLGDAFLAKKDKNEAMKNFNKALELYPANLKALVPIFNTYVDAKQLNYAQKLIDKALEYKPTDLFLLIKQAEVSIQNSNWNTAEAAVQKIAVFNKELAIFFQANIHQGKLEYAQAIELYKEFLQYYPDHFKALVNLTESYKAMNENSEAISYLTQLLESNRLNNNAALVLNDLYITDKELEKARQLMVRQIAASPKNSDLYAGLAKVYLAQNNKDDAFATYKKGLEKYPFNINLSMLLAAQYEESGAPKEAMAIYEKLVEKHPDLEVAGNNLAFLYIDDNGEYLKKGLQLAEKNKSSDNPYFQDTYAWGLIRSGKFGEGQKILESIIIKEPDVTDFRYHLGVAYYKSENYAAAIGELKQALQLAEKNKAVFKYRRDTDELLEEIQKRRILQK